MTGRLINEGMGGFLNPPTHPEHHWRIQSFGNCWSLSAALTELYFRDETRALAQAKLDEWVRPPMDDPEIKDWILQIMGYFRGCYQNLEVNMAERAYVTKFIHNRMLNPIAEQDLHAGVCFIRQLYPEFILTEEHVKNAYWGKKP